MSSSTWKQGSPPPFDAPDQAPSRLHPKLFKKCFSPLISVNIFPNYILSRRSRILKSPLYTYLFKPKVKTSPIFLQSGSRQMQLRVMVAGSSCQLSRNGQAAAACLPVRPGPARHGPAGVALLAHCVLSRLAGALLWATTQEYEGFLNSNLQSLQTNFRQNAALPTMSDIEYLYLGILLSFYSGICISIELSHPKISSCRDGVVNILWFFEKRLHNILNKYSSKCSRIFSR